MSDSDSGNSGTTCPVKYIDLCSMAGEDDEKDGGDVALSIPMDLTTVVTQEEIETMLKCTMKALDSNSEAMNILLELNRMCSLKTSRVD